MKELGMKSNFKISDNKQKIIGVTSNKYDFMMSPHASSSVSPYNFPNKFSTSISLGTG